MAAAPLSRAPCSDPRGVVGVVPIKSICAGEHAQASLKDVERCCHLLEWADAPLSDDACEFGPFDPLEPLGDDESSPTCPSCGQPMIPQGEISKPSWEDVMASADRPRWYDPLHRRAETVAPSHLLPL